MISGLGEDFIPAGPDRRYTEVSTLFPLRIVLSENSSKKKIVGKGKGMDSRRKNTNRDSDQKKSADLWVASKPSSSSDAIATRKWSEPPASAAGSRLLELADIALGLKKPEKFRKRRSEVLKQKP
jgi:hypothetical protein